MFFAKIRRRFKVEENEKPRSTETRQVVIEGEIPIITLDNSWHQLVGEIKTPEIDQLEKTLNKLLQEQGKLNTDYIDYTRLKKDMLDKILELTHEAFDLKSDKAIKEIENQQKMILKINENVEKIEKRLDVVPGEIERVNRQLVDASVEICYGHINEYRKKSYELDEEIQEIRTTLMKKTEEKKDYDKRADRMYQYLHQLVGANIINQLDSTHLEYKNQELEE